MRGKYLKTVGLAVLCLGFLAAVPQTKAAPTELLNVTNSTWFYLQNASDQGTAWRAVGFDAAAAGWSSGNGLFGLETSGGVNYGTPGTILLGGTRFNTQWNAPAASGITIYCRSTFNWVGSPVGAVLTATLRVDDGAVIYINGVEAYRYNMPAGAIGFQTVALGANPLGEPNIVTGIAFAGPSVVTGVNEIAVEVHQNAAGSTDVVFGLDMFGDVAVAPTFNDPAQPADATVTQGRDRILIGNASGLPTPTYQWFKDGVAIATGGTGPTYTITDMDSTKTGQYYVEASNSAVTTPVRGRTAVIGYLADTAGPTLLSAYLRADNKVVATFNEAMNPLFFDAFGMSVYLQGGDPNDTLGIATGTLENGSNWVFTLTTPPSGVAGYAIDVYAGAVEDRFLNDSELDFTFNLSREIILLPFDSVWKFNQSGTDFHTTTPDFNDVAFDDSAWTSGPGLHGREGNLGPGNTVAPGYFIQTPLLSTGNGGPSFTSYMRKTFTLPIPVSALSDLRVRFLQDDGCAIYLNGVEIARDSLAAGAGFATVGTSHEADEINTATFTGFVDGPNTLAVEIHDLAGSTDLAFGMEVIGLAATIPVVDPTVTDPTPADQTVAEGASVIYTVSTTGFPIPTVQWFKDGVAIAGATTLTYSIPSAGAAEDGTYTVRADNGSGNPDTSAGARLRVTIDTTGPVLTRAIATTELDTIFLEFNEGLDEETGTNVANYAVALRAGGGNLTINQVTLNGARTMATLDTSDRLPSQNYRITITGVKDDSAAKNLINPNPTVANVWSEVVVVDTDAATTWRYFDTFAAGDTVGLDGQAWKTAAFNDSAWETGAALFYSKRGTPGTTDIPTRTAYPTINLSNTTDTAQLPTVYFRKAFNVTFDPATTPVRLHYIFDDGMAVYFNGTEVHRVGMSTTVNPILFSTLATTTVGNDMLFSDSVGVSAAALTQGANNVIAAEVHQVNVTSSDLAFALQVLILQETVTPGAVITGVTINASGHLIISFIGDNVYIQRAPNLNTVPPAFATIAGPVSTGTFDAGVVTSPNQYYFRLSSTP